MLRGGNMKYFGLLLSMAAALFLLSCQQSSQGGAHGRWETLKTDGEPTARHEASIIAVNDKIYLIGGRRINPVDEFDPQTKTWTQKSASPLEIHHFQAVAVDEKIYILGAMTGAWPHETPLENVLIYDPKTDVFEFGAEIPKARRRGGAGAVYSHGKIYLIGGITNGHMDGYVNWFDAYDPQTDVWTVLPDAPHRRDHFQAAVAGNKLYAFAGRHSEQRADLGFEQTVIPGDVFDLETGQWEAGRKETNIPTPRAGNMAIGYHGNIIIGGGESGTQVAAHNDVDVYNIASQTWSEWPDLAQGRHGSGFVILDDYLYTISGSGNRGGGPELTTIERLKIPQAGADEANRAENLAKTVDVAAQADDKINQRLTAPNQEPKTRPETPSGEPMLWHSFELDFEGPQTSETAEDNPFVDYRLLVEFSHGEDSYLIRGFYAADGEAGQTGAASGNLWRVRFTPDKLGQWSYKARFSTGKNIAIDRDPSSGRTLDLAAPNGTFNVVPSTATGKDFRAPERGRLRKDGKLFRFVKSGDYWLKGGPNSPENLLGYAGFDDTYRLVKQSRDGEASTIGDIHSFDPHLKDWNEGDPVWGVKSGKPRGHAIIGAMNYLAAQGMNTVYFLTNNITGDGNDVWPYVAPKDKNGSFNTAHFDRFDVSKLAQWNILFDHMQSKGILLHMVTQETENERMLDDGNTEFYRKLYYSELIARFGHHPALVWNLGEENGPSSWMKTGQTHQQRQDMAQFFAENDPYDHTVLLHSHAATDDIDYTFAPLLGDTPLDGMSLQVDNARDVYDLTKAWHKRSLDAGNQWLITLDEIGKWYNGALPDDIDPDHDILRQHVLWGHLLAGGAGVEWYFGGKFHSNDISMEDWRTRHNLWTQTRYALEFFEDYLPFWRMGDCGGAMGRDDVYCLAAPGEIYAFYMPGRGSSILSLPENDTGGYSVAWFDPKTGGALQSGSVKEIGFGSNQFIGYTPNTKTQGWVVLIRKK
jgi:hypothetical protein